MANKNSKKATPSKTQKAEEPLDQFDPEQSQLVAHARRELSLTGIDKADSDYGGAIATAVLDLVTLFASQRHSGASAELTKEIFYKLVGFEPLGPITDDPEEWESVSKQFNEPMWQNKRAPALFSKDGGKTFMHVGTKKRGTSVSHKKKATPDATEETPPTQSKTDS